MSLRVDGLTPQVLQTSRRSWWDEHFTRLLLDAIPLGTRMIVELDCGLAAAAHVLLPSLPEARYLGVDFNPERLAEARTELEASRIASRAEVRLIPPCSLPVDESFCDVVLSIMSLQHRPDLLEVLAEAKRVLQPRGRVVAVEPDNLGQRFYFDGVLEEVTMVIHALSLRARVARQPADIALGPRLPSLFRESGLHKVAMVAHLVHSSRTEAASAFFKRLRRIARSIAELAELPADDELLHSCDEAIDRSLYAGLPKRVGFSCHTVPIFMSVGLKP